MSLAQRLTALRKNAGLTQSELGNQLNISAQAISKWEKGISEPDIATLKRIADIYGVSISYIIDPENASEGEDEAASAGESLFDSLCDVYLERIHPDRKLDTIRYLRDMLGLGLAEAKAAVESLPFCITGSADAELGERIVRHLAEIDATVTLKPSCGMHPRNPALSLEPRVYEARKSDMKLRFLIANLTALLPAIALLIINLLYLFTPNLENILFTLYFAISAYCLVFLLWYPTVTRKLLYFLWAYTEAETFFEWLLVIAVFPFLLLLLCVVGLLSPINYIFGIRIRIRRMREGDHSDDIFSFGGL